MPLRVLVVVLVVVQGLMPVLAADDGDGGPRRPASF